MEPTTGHTRAGVQNNWWSINLVTGSVRRLTCLMSGDELLGHRLIKQSPRLTGMTNPTMNCAIGREQGKNVRAGGLRPRPPTGIEGPLTTLNRRFGLDPSRLWPGLLGDPGSGHSAAVRRQRRASSRVTQRTQGRLGLAVEHEQQGLRCRINAEAVLLPVAQCAERNM